MTSLPSHDPPRKYLEGAELRALIDAVDDQAAAFLIACVHFAKLMQVDVEQGDAYDVLKAITEEMYARRDYYQSYIDPTSNRIILPPLTDSAPHGQRGGVQ